MSNSEGRSRPIMRVCAREGATNNVRILFASARPAAIIGATEEKTGSDHMPAAGAFAAALGR